MTKSHLPKKLPELIAAGSFFGLVLILLAANPLISSTVIAVFFGLLLIFLFSLARLAVLKGVIKANSYKKITGLSVIIVTLIMLKSAQSLGFADLVIIALVSVGLFFYLSQRS